MLAVLGPKIPALLSLVLSSFPSSYLPPSQLRCVVPPPPNANRTKAKYAQRMPKKRENIYTRCGVGVDSDANLSSS